MWLHAKEHAGQHTSRECGGNGSPHDSRGNRCHAMSEHVEENLLASRAECDADTDLLGAAGTLRPEGSGDTDDGDEQRYSCESSKQDRGYAGSS